MLQPIEFDAVAHVTTDFELPQPCGECLRGRDRLGTPPGRQRLLFPARREGHLAFVHQAVGHEPAQAGDLLPGVAVLQVQPQE